MTSSIKIRDATTDELGVVEELVMEACKEFRPLLPEDLWNDWMESIHETISSEHGTIIVAEINGNIEGAVQFYADARKIKFSTASKGWSSIRILSVRPNGREKGLGELLIKECI
ncbi:hypothetical protein KKA95_03070, partial [Patescibacteria group bacterium]|nr:hypothetical protein [Patescibacteria group bacterium]